MRSKFVDMSRMVDGSKWHFVDAAQSVEQVHSEIWATVQDTLHKVHAGNQPLGKLWQEGSINLTKYSDEKENRR